ncbi:hypothetical protein RvY_00392 [Ramazzottius varieornatus]|uniref:Chromo domain-containing protein n=1 Tax=Ramazzottius varieornatus TaxID=947166 RepID=A0A1D1UIX2_RAMVA|nr:hypothetical protein RvY_00392 [Ramazzottius varieornatus]
MAVVLKILHNSGQHRGIWIGDGGWKVEKIIGHKDFDPAKGFPEMFKIKWLGWEEKFSSFEPAENFADTEALADYLKSHQVNANEAARLRSFTDQDHRKQISAPLKPRRGRHPKGASKLTNATRTTLVSTWARSSAVTESSFARPISIVTVRKTLDGYRAIRPREDQSVDPSMPEKLVQKGSMLITVTPKPGEAIITQ